jgi:hypothetical protein
MISVTSQHKISCPLASNAINHFLSPSNGGNGFWPLSNGGDHFWTSMPFNHHPPIKIILVSIRWWQLIKFHHLATTLCQPKVMVTSNVDGCDWFQLQANHGIHFWLALNGLISLWFGTSQLCLKFCHIVWF